MILQNLAVVGKLHVKFEWLKVFENLQSVNTAEDISYVAKIFPLVQWIFAKLF